MVPACCMVLSYPIKKYCIFHFLPPILEPVLFWGCKIGKFLSTACGTEVLPKFLLELGEIDRTLNILSIVAMPHKSPWFSNSEVSGFLHLWWKNLYWDIGYNMDTGAAVVCSSAKLRVSTTCRLLASGRIPRWTVWWQGLQDVDVQASCCPTYFVYSNSESSSYLWGSRSIRAKVERAPRFCSGSATNFPGWTWLSLCASPLFRFLTCWGTALSRWPRGPPTLQSQGLFPGIQYGLVGGWIAP